MASNQDERQRWNDEYWVTAWPRREAMTSVVTASLLERLAPAPGERIVEVGSGGGVATLELARRVGAGAVVGVDLSAGLVDLARTRARAAGVANVDFVVGDAQVDELPGAPFDAVTSQFGVMFFDEPTRAFANLRAATVPGGRLVFACWAPVEHNPWSLAPVLAAVVEPPAPPAPGKSATGPFALADADVTRDLLVGAGWAGVRVETLVAPARLERAAMVDDDYLTFVGVAAADLARARRLVDEHLAAYTTSDGRLDVTLTYLVVSATNPSP